MNPFKIPGVPCLNNTPFEQLDVWAWCREMNDRRREIEFGNYLKARGFKMGEDKITPEELKVIESAIETYHHIAPHMGLDPIPFNELFPTEGEFSVRDKGKWKPSEDLVAALVRSGWIYHVLPDTTYFEIINGRLIAKYQQILGSRSLALVKE